jgi:hypothetical protein
VGDGGVGVPVDCAMRRRVCGACEHQGRVRIALAQWALSTSGSLTRATLAVSECCRHCSPRLKAGQSVAGCAQGVPAHRRPWHPLGALSPWGSKVASFLPPQSSEDFWEASTMPRRGSTTGMSATTPCRLSCVSTPRRIPRGGGKRLRRRYVHERGRALGTDVNRRCRRRSPLCPGCPGATSFAA